jgi:hypothetical protein
MSLSTSFLPLTPPLKPQLRVNIPSWIPPPGTASSPPSFGTPLTQRSPSLSSSEISTRSLLLYTIEMLPDRILAPSTWRSHALVADPSSPMSLSYLVPETNVTVEVTGYANEQYVIRLLGQQNLLEEDKAGINSPLIAVSILGHQCDGERYDVPAWKIRESLLERIGWNREID